MRRRPITIRVAALGIVGIVAVIAAAILPPPPSPAPGAAGPVLRFVDATASSGLTHAYDGDVE